MSIDFPSKLQSSLNSSVTFVAEHSGLQAKIRRSSRPQFWCVFSNAVLTQNKSIVGGAILTGMEYQILNSAETFLSWDIKLARVQNPEGWKNLDDGYIIWAGLITNIATFFKQPFYEVGAVKAAEANKQPIRIMEIISQGITPLRTNFTGPVLVLMVGYDFIFCTGYCGGILLPGAQKTFPDFTGREVRMPPNASDGINLSSNATGSFGIITDFLARHGF